MVKYTCLRCGYSNKIKSKFIKHLNRKFTCEPKLNNIPINEVYNYYFDNNNSLVNSNKPLFTSISLKCPSEKTPIYSFICEHCNRSYTRKDNLTRHLKRCKVKLNAEENKNQLEDLKKLVDLLNLQMKEQNKQLKQKDKQISELMKKVGVNIGTQNNITNNVQNNIKILAYNKTDLSHLKDKDYMKFLNHNCFCVPHMIKQIHFDPEKPENHNIYISNIKNNYVMAYDGNKWNIKDRNEVIDDMLESGDDITGEVVYNISENITNVMSSNSFYSDVYTQIYVSLLEKYEFIHETLQTKLQGYISSSNIVEKIRAIISFFIEQILH